MARNLKVIFNNSEMVDCSEGMTYKEISLMFKDYYDYDIVGVKVDNDFADLSDTIKKSCNIKFYDRSSDYGNDVYLRSAKFILILAENSSND